jgi:gamma-hexachlorocyclohexane dehydrochlorinase
MAEGTFDGTLDVGALLARIDRLESRLALRDLVSDYCHGFDKGDFERFRAIWWPDCVWNIGPPFGAFDGHAGVEQAVREVLWPFWRETHHVTTNLKVDFDDADHARGECDVDCMGADREGNFLVVGATYYDRFERRDGVWRIARRDVTMHYFNPLPGAEMSAPGDG